MKSLIIILTLALALPAFAGREGGGGTGIVCLDAKNKIKWVQMYDFWNASQEYNLNITIDNKTPYMQQIERNMQRLENTDPVLADYIRERSKFFAPEQINNNSEVGFVTGLFDNGDGKHMVKPNSASKTPGCTKLEARRMAYYKDNPKPFERKFLLTKELWNKASESTKYALVQHEILYEVARKLEDTDSVNAQYLNAFISSDEFESIDWEKYANLTYNYFSWTRSYRNTAFISVKIGDVVATNRSKKYNLPQYGTTIKATLRLFTPTPLRFAGRDIQAVDKALLTSEFKVKCTRLYSDDKSEGLLENINTTIGVTSIKNFERDLICQDEDEVVNRGIVTKDTRFSYDGINHLIPANTGYFLFYTDKKIPRSIRSKFCPKKWGKKKKVVVKGKTHRLKRGEYVFYYDEKGELEHLERRTYGQECD